MKNNKTATVGSEVASELTYENALRKWSESLAMVTVQGRIINRPAGQISGPRGCTPILWCLCVQDSPENPCPCDGPIIWLPDGSIRIRKRAGRRNDGLVDIDVEANTRVFVEDTREINDKDSGMRLMRAGPAGQFEAVAETFWVQEFTPMRIGTLQKALELIEKNPTLTVMAKKKGKGFWAKIVAAFEAGWAIGEFIDEETGLSDKISDWLLDTFGPWPW